MNILVDNAGFINKGAELMLRSCEQEIKNKFKNAKLVINPHTVGGKTSKPIGEDFLIYQDHVAFSILPEKINRKFFFVKPNEIDYLLDAGGFQFGDQWATMFNTTSNRKASNYYKNLRKSGAKLIFLPQAFGPFKNVMAAERMKFVAEQAHLLFARDKISYQYLVDLLGKDDKIVLKPDFTNLMKPQVPLTQFINDKAHVCVIPNSKMMSATDEKVSNAYIDFMTTVCELFINANKSLILLNHEGDGDKEIIDKIQQNLTKKALVLSGLNAIEVKAVIAKMEILVSSRFHGVVSGLSQGVCTFATGWSHKYPELLGDFGVAKNLLDVLQPEIAHEKIITALKNNNSKHHTSPTAILAMEKKSKSMWEQVWSI
ncbi:MAG: polysaccharide pyruvyl transferase family protein [Leeuwenhoekiella sp.]